MIEREDSCDPEREWPFEPTGRASEKRCGCAAICVSERNCSATVEILLGR